MSETGGKPVIVRRRAGDPNPNNGPAAKRPRHQQNGEHADRNRRESLHLSQHMPPAMLEEKCGVITQVTMQNFMCHKNFAIKLNHKVNFIIGQNGSGKSAILTAVMIALGSRARDTDRGSGIKEVIRTGQPSATVTVSLLNRGCFAFKQEKYGDAITVERYISASGASQYKIRDSRGKVVSTERKELTGILDAFNIQVDNPISILTQDTSKNFLRKDNPKDKYRLFLRATQLEQIKKFYAITTHDRNSALAALNEKKQGMAAADEEVKKLERQIELHKNLHKVKEREDRLRRELQWAKVQEKEEELQKAVAEREKRDKMLAEIDKNENKCKTALANIQTKRKELEDQFKTLTTEADEQNSQLSQCQAEYKRLSQQHVALKERHSAALAKVRHARRDRDELRKQIEQHMATTFPDYAELQRGRQEQMQKLEQRVTELEALERSRQAHLDHISASVRKNQEDAHGIRAEESRCKAEIDQISREVERMQRSSADPRSVFGGWVADVDREVDNCMRQRRFHKRPIGPVGAYLKLKAGCESWAPLVETCLAGLLEAYLVDNRDDLLVMKDIIGLKAKNERRKPQVISSSFLNKVHDVSRHGLDLSGGRVSVWSVLDVSHPVVANTIIDQAGVESVMLLKSDEEARNLMAYQDRVPRGCNQTLTSTGYSYFPDPQYRTYPIQVGQRARYLQVSTTEIISNLQSDLQRRREDLGHVAASKAEIQHDLQQNQAEQQRTDDHLKKTRAEIRQARRKMDELRNAEDPQPVNLRILEEELESYDRTIAEGEQAAEPIQQELEASEQRRLAAQQKLDEIRSRVGDTLGDKLQRVKSALDENERDYEREQRRVVLMDRKRQQVWNELPQLDEARQQIEGQVQEALEQAEGDRLRVRDAVWQIKSKLEGILASQQEQREAVGMSWDEVQTAYHQAKASRESMQKEVRGYLQEIDLIGEMLDERNRRYEALLQNLGCRIVHYFCANPLARKFSAELIFRHQERELLVVSSPRLKQTPAATQNNASASGPKRAPQQMSGGERSSLTLAFILALWETMPTPFRMLDEFDVFMDEVNRKISQDILVSSALAQNGQFVFISPLSIPGAKENTNISIHKMHPPERNQTTIKT